MMKSVVVMNNDARVPVFQQRQGVEAEAFRQERCSADGGISRAAENK